MYRQQFSRSDTIGELGEHTLLVDLADAAEVFAAALAHFEALIAGVMGRKLFWGPRGGERDAHANR